MHFCSSLWQSWVSLPSQGNIKDTQQPKAGVYSPSSSVHMWETPAWYAVLPPMDSTNIKCEYKFKVP